MQVEAEGILCYLMMIMRQRSTECRLTYGNQTLNVLQVNDLSPNGMKGNLKLQRTKVYTKKYPHCPQFVVVCVIYPSPKVIADFFRHKYQHDSFIQLAHFLVD